MTLLMQYIDLIFHIDRTLQEVVTLYGVWTYGLIFLIIFLETGLVITPFLPGDSLLFMVGTLCGLELLNWPLAMALCSLAAIAGDQLNFYTGRHLSQYLLKSPLKRLINPQTLIKTHHFFDTYGPSTLVLARFMPLIRTFAPFVAGLSEMNIKTFSVYNATGGLLWVISVLSLGLWFGQLTWVHEHLQIIIWSLILVPSVLAIWSTWKTQKKTSDSNLNP
jgi:membrane-associated protein